MKAHIDVCNGDADGLCALVQWRLHEPRAAHLITGLKREIELLQQVHASRGDELLVCDLSLRRNRAALVRLLEAGVKVRYFDHHDADELTPALAHPLLDAHIDCGADVCTSLLVDHYLGGLFTAWALVGAYGDNLTQVADARAEQLGLGEQDRRRLQALGEAINYNAYGDSTQDVLIAPAQLFPILMRYRHPIALLERESIAQELQAQRQSDLHQAGTLIARWQDAHTRVYMLPDAPWSRRVIGTLVNQLANEHPEQAHAVLKAKGAGGLLVSVRAPLATPGGAAALCHGFGGGGRAGAAGIDHLAEQELPRFMQALALAHWGAVAAPVRPAEK
ncbi:MAG: hypothetical protein KJ614_18750 [Gammaproteobacteria bacterium]|uniref:hypothetical protein n=1 Tax=Rhodoferax sp. TaxID=50421 RepID=UPI0017C70C98|nr:hypothetical protein [Rhodoferax sp.]MBU3900924.1 hypothetical protein [Gammaproteobacteria bacterium]MBA3057458.1 hypothetical protein [Rhodoferax sp.]MBU3996847.1 hypothetical protein [Gammaproteobacteria bacterium]MBU4017598.1 hypothetical protein [Gammaproteobacteria bacterium]MBU4081041.1 hypothetical protein [Gammaproteobacteria bacterium]